MSENKDFNIPEVTVGDKITVQDDNYDLDNIPIFWGPKQPYSEDSYLQPDYTKWRSAEILRVPSVVRLIAEIDPEYDGRKLKKKNGTGTGRCGAGVTWLYLGYRHVYNGIYKYADNLVGSPCRIKGTRGFYFLNAFVEEKNLGDPPYNYHKTTTQIIAERTIVDQHTKLDFQNVNGLETGKLITTSSATFLCESTGEMVSHFFPLFPVVGNVGGDSPYLPEPSSHLVTDADIEALAPYTSGWIAKLTLFFFYPCIRLINDGTIVGLSVIAAFGDWYTDPAPFQPEPYE